MTLSEFITHNLEPILAAWEQDAKKIPPAASLGREALRNSLDRLLQAVARDMAQEQSPELREARSKGLAEAPELDRDSPSEAHAAARLIDGFGIDHLVAEYRALRATIVRLWVREGGHQSVDAASEVTRLNESLDEVLIRSVHLYSRKLERSRQLFLGVLAHDLRTPLTSIRMTAEQLRRAKPSPDELDAALDRIMNTSQRAMHMATDLLDIARVQLGGEFPISRQPADLRATCKNLIEELRAAHPQHRLELELSGDLHGNWDADRVAQMVCNLLENSIQHGSSTAGVTLAARAINAEIVLEVHNEGDPIPQEFIQQVFDPLMSSRINEQQSTNLGLGLYVAKAIAEAHAGSIAVDSSEEHGTTFTVRLPRDRADDD